MTQRLNGKLARYVSRSQHCENIAQLYACQLVT
jgi:hypothetical protein